MAKRKTHVGVKMEIPHKPGQQLQRRLIIFGVLSGLFAWGSFSIEKPGAGVIATLIAFALIWIASKVKTTKKLKDLRGHWE